jgi:hypothetical protein
MTWQCSSYKLPVVFCQLSGELFIRKARAQHGCLCGGIEQVVVVFALGAAAAQEAAVVPRIRS